MNFHAILYKICVGKNIQLMVMAIVGTPSMTIDINNVLNLNNTS
jgi:hypothetical protein